MLPHQIRIGPRTIKTAAAVIVAMVIVHFYGTTTSRMTFAMLGAMAAVEPTFNDSLRSCLAQIVGVFFGSLVGLFLRRSRQKRQIESFHVCEGKAKELLARMTILSCMEQPGCLSRENRKRLRACGAVIEDGRPMKNFKERDVVVNYHVAQILKLRRELLEALRS